MSQGHSPVEDQHPLGHHNDEQFSMPFLGNLHRAMDDGKRDWPERTLTNPDGSPLLKAAACVRSACDWLRMIVDLRPGSGRRSFWRHSTSV